uniref:Protein xylosyltransferase n=1 Tax=Trieres chinensis TaxID=1514140 RepID=A0A7S1ZIR3_TRICV|mmetsp:Transcript_26201/g.53673  ORF Transcript_26201/g.53673 Transcript_26201/m.53673 type:complete len:438 (+) Transcript_26201:130-1443(+)|eukprot:CAMPEP_0183293136 /NCGR_PEP_ID=MMETSP0160_2-20130417/1939_1 /TAXON_ID=2839 ORGANISM="Odontella Sinensis, Strain Grunow 1884" /NCGR_SAMPLE_ID=MMETSP0160_2 /ASSEMBLY_ACC=CAM_ASM_000250 /LENGTH=437 /DNA_ID=CAMNT_0025454201 /DNA_START=130 /DNA_END=1443 /DNA_ORIENTATION=-
MTAPRASPLVRAVVRLRPNHVAASVGILLLSFTAFLSNEFGSRAPSVISTDQGVLGREFLRNLAEIRSTLPGAMAADPRKVAFLFLTEGGSIAHEGAWRRWFESSGASKDDWKEKANIYVHVKNSPDERLEGRPRTWLDDLGNFFCSRVIPSVVSDRFHLHHAMMQLLMYGYVDPNNSHFIFVGDGSVPLKSFDDLYLELSEEDRSRTCLAPPGEAREAWAPFAYDPRVAAVPPEDRYKGSLWSSYGRSHVAFLLSNTDELSEWYDAHSERGAIRSGTAGELLLPTFLNSHVHPDEISDCHTRALIGEEGSSLDDPADEADNEGSAWGCCNAYVRSDAEADLSPRDPRSVLAPEFAKEALNTDGAYEVLHESTLREVAKAPHFLTLRKVARNAVVVMESGAKVALEYALPEVLGYEERRDEQEEKEEMGKRKCIVNH